MTILPNEKGKNMSGHFLWTKSGTRLNLIKHNSGKALNWLFLPGGLGRDSEYLHTLTKDLNLPGMIWHVDLPGNGSNHLIDKNYQYDNWPDELLQLVKFFPNPIFIGHSCAGMLLLSQPKLKNI